LGEAAISSQFSMFAFGRLAGESDLTEARQGGQGVARGGGYQRRGAAKRGLYRHGLGGLARLDWESLRVDL